MSVPSKRWMDFLRYSLLCVNRLPLVDVPTAHFTITFTALPWVSLHFKRLPQDVTNAELTTYLTSLALDAGSPSRSGFKHTVYGLRYYFRHIGLEKRAIDLPSLKKVSKLPVVLNNKELR